MINKTEGVCKGQARIGNTRIPVWAIVLMINQHRAMSDITRKYPGITISQIGRCMSYYAQNKEEIDEILADKDSCWE